ncbi:sensor histidine kinase [Roseburia intestinalis]|uniref:histidine kinase n=1 Tax=Roseburia intestinalis L1-82 TaxID=536231 RepID=C7GAM3_9FIRM|nr:HAMP domain-containing sensor histidine kinase [Roseburia intestinalis]EEV01041.1 histidine kinase A domain protein [Roseburia intestinalis L1-82]UWP55798.1 HAMP domain-containing histidine kinase [Roseburia intestinalis]VCV20293.1 Alkaline phosphatase synthesis sensor protein PhoR [Roseburia intestinalis L1-82]
MRKVKNWRGSTAAKIIAWIALSASALCFVFSAVGVIFMFDEGIYRNSKDETRKQWFENVSYEYGLSAVDDVRREQPAGSVESKYFKYGIIKADSLEGIDLNDEKSYAERNFSDKISLEDVYTNSVELSDEDQIVYTNGNFLTGGGVELMYSGEDSWVSVYADRICYDEAKGIFVYLAGNEYYPVQKVETDIGRYGSAAFTYDTEKKMYVFEHTDGTGDAASAERTVTDETLTDAADGDIVAESTEEPLTDVTDSGMDDIANGEYVTFDMFDGTRMDVNHWGNVLLDGVREISMDEIDRVDSSEKNKEDASVSYTTHEDYYLDSNYTLWVNMGNTSPKTTYQMVVILPQNVGTDWNSTDLYVQANTLLNFVYSMRYTALVTMFVSFIIGAAAFVFLMCAAGHRNGTDEIVTTVWDHLWLDVFAVGAVLAEVFVFYVAEIFLINVDVAYLPFILFVTAVATLCMGWLLLLFLLSFSVRVKLGKWWRHTLCYQLFRKIGQFARMIWENIGFLWKVILVMLVLAFFEGIGVLMFFNSDIALLLWLLEKLVLYPLVLWYCVQLNQLKNGTEKIAGGEPGYQISTKRMNGIFKEQGEQINHISDGMTHAIEERMKSERFKTELITNVSHDIKTPLTSIINYVDLLEKEDLHNETAQEYLEVLERQSSRLKKLIEDLIEASKASTGNLPVHLERLEAGIFMTQTVGEFEEKTKEAGLDLVIEKPETQVYIMADSRHFWRVIDNLMNNICKYAQSGTRVYINLEVKEAQVSITFRNTSKYPLNISSDELMERFVRGDASRNTEGSGLGLSIANSLMDLMGGTFRLYVDGDLFKVVLGFAETAEKETKEKIEEL